LSQSSAAPSPWNTAGTHEFLSEMPCAPVSIGSLAPPSTAEDDLPRW